MNKNNLKFALTLVILLFCTVVVSQLPKPVPAQSKLPRSTSVVIKETADETQQHILQRSKEGWKVTGLTSYYTPYHGGTAKIIIVMEK